MSVEEVSMDRIVDALKNRRFEAALIEGVSGPTLLRPYQLWHSKGAVNPGGLGSPSMDVALDRIRHAASDDEYARAVASFQQTIVDDPPAIFLAWIQRARAVSKRFMRPAPQSRAGISWPRFVCGNRSRRPRARAKTDGASHPAHRDQVRPPAGRRGGAASARLRLRLDPLPPARHARIGRQRQPERRGPRRRRNPPLRRRQRRAAQGALRRPPEHRPRAVAAGPHPQELRPPVPRVPRDHAVRRNRRDDRVEPRRQAARGGPERRPPGRRRRRDVADPRRRRPAADIGVRHPPDPPQPAGRLARRRVQPRRDVADGRSDPHRRARLRDGRRPGRRARSRTATPTRRRSSRRRAT